MTVLLHSNDDTPFSERFSDHKLLFMTDWKGLMAMTLKLDVLAMCAAFVFLAAIVFGLF